MNVADAGHVALPQPQPGRQLRRGEVDERPGRHVQFVVFGPGEQAVDLVPAIDCLLALDGVPGEGDRRPVERAEQERGQRRLDRGRGQPRGQAGVELAGVQPLMADLEDLIEVGVHHRAGGLVAQHQALRCDWARTSCGSPLQTAWPKVKLASWICACSSGVSSRPPVCQSAAWLRTWLTLPRASSTRRL